MSPMFEKSQRTQIFYNMLSNFPWTSCTEIILSKCTEINVSISVYGKMFLLSIRKSMFHSSCSALFIPDLLKKSRDVEKRVMSKITTSRERRLVRNSRMFKTKSINVCNVLHSIGL